MKPRAAVPACRGCGSAEVSRAIDLGEVPASDVFPPATGDANADPRYPLELWMCRSCSLIQLGPKAATQPEQPGPVESQTMLRHAAASARTIVMREGLGPSNTVAERHSAHGGSWGPELQRLGLSSVGDTVPADLVVDVHFLMHAEDLSSVLADHAARLTPEGVLVCEFFHALPMVTGNLIDTIRHGHYSYLSLISAVENFARHDLVVTWAAQVPSYGGSLQVTARPTSQTPRVDDSVGQLRQKELEAGLDDISSVTELGRRGRRGPVRLRSELETLRRRGRRVAAYGAPSKATVLLTLADVDSDLMPYTVDLSPAKAGRRIPGTRIPILSVTELLQDRPDDVVLLTWDIADEVADQLAQQARGMAWDPVLHVPLPELRRRSLSETSWVAVS